MRFVTPTRRRWASNYYITRCTGSSTSWWSDELEIICGREYQYPADGALRPPIEQLQRRCWNEKNVPERLGPWLRSPAEWDRNTVMAIRVGVNMLQFFSVSNWLWLVEEPSRMGQKHCYGHKSKTVSNPFEPFQIKWEVYFSKQPCRLSLLCRRYDSACIQMYINFVAIQYMIWCLMPVFTPHAWLEHG